MFHVIFIHPLVVFRQPTRPFDEVLNLSFPETSLCWLIRSTMRSYAAQHVSGLATAERKTLVDLIQHRLHGRQFYPLLADAGESIVIRGQATAPSPTSPEARNLLARETLPKSCEHCIFLVDIVLTNTCEVGLFSRCEEISGPSRPVLLSSFKIIVILLATINLPSIFFLLMTTFGLVDY